MMQRINSSSPQDPESQNYQEPVRETVSKSYTSQHSSSVIFGFYALFFLFAISFCGSIAIVLLMAATKNNVSFKLHTDPTTGNPEITENPGLGQFGSTATGIILIGVPLLILILLIFYSYLHDMRRYFSPGI